MGCENTEPRKMRNLEKGMSEHEKISSRTQHFSGYFPDFAHCAAPEGCRRGRASVVDGGRGQQHRGRRGHRVGRGGGASNNIRNSTGNLSRTENVDFQTLRSRFSTWTRKHFLPLPLAEAIGGRKSIENAKIS